ncbi:conserved hypothetical protein [Leishmania major strain Friedlin]|uniref:Protein kinase domain-containing protein n=1 Tax=Leishmania major TaxID=5664 RepID=Q4Q8Y0_LEIMA|nr:conserved hypothetical protein [Leishmania major strain Friedlin]CAG9576537.1 hypothetical_protein_-_conserved [Leishmania major strain Friedlin]CAJ05526.1 conserved hypothetical protein [Leishmania major strain Friedlin]|eukprot:XP_001684218.1 conserved hypothetical protein [Leishmania major strain Friedlin]
MRTASSATFGSDFSNTCHEGSILEVEAREERVDPAGSGRHLPVPALRGGVTVGGTCHSSEAVLSGAAGTSLGEAFDGRRQSRNQRQFSAAHQQRLLPVPPSQRSEGGDDFMGTSRDVGFNDSFDGFPLYVDEDGVMKVSGHRRRDPFAFGYDAVEEADSATDGAREGDGGHRNSYHGGAGAALGSSSGTSDGALVSGSSSYSSSLYEEHYEPSHQQRGRASIHGYRYSADTNAVARYLYTPLEMHYAGSAGIAAPYDDDGAPVPINAALPSHHHIVSRRRRLVGAASSAEARLHNAKRRRPSRKTGKRARRRGTRGGRLGRRNTKAAAASHSSVGRHGSHSGKHSSGCLPTRLSGSSPALLGTNPLLNIGGGNVAATASAAAAAGIHGGRSTLLSAGASINVGPSEAEKVVRMREYLLAREAAVKKRYPAARRNSAGTASTGATVGSDRGAWKTAAADTLRVVASSRTGDRTGRTATSSGALASQRARGAGPFSPLPMPQKNLNRSIGLNAGKAGAGSAFALAALRSARLRSKDATTQLQAVTTTGNSVYVRADPASAAAARARGSDGKGISGGEGAPGAMHSTTLAAGTATHFEQRMMTLHDPYTGLAIAPAYTPLVTRTETAVAVHTCAAGIQFFRDPTAPRPSAVAFLPSTSSALPDTPSRLVPTAYVLDVSNPPPAPTPAGTATVSDEGSLRAFFGAPYTSTTPHMARSASAAYRRPTSFHPFGTSLKSTATPPQGRQLASPGFLDKKSAKVHNPGSLVMDGNPSATSLSPQTLHSRDGVARVDNAATAAGDSAQVRRCRPAKTDRFCDVRPRLTARDGNANAGAPPAVASSGNGCVALLDVSGPRSSDQYTATSLSFGDCARSWWRLQSGGAAAAGGYSSAAAPAAAADMSDSSDLFPWRWRGSASAFHMRGGEGQDEVPIAAAWQDEAVRGCYGVWPAAVYLRGAADEYDVSLPPAGTSSSASAAMPRFFAWPHPTPQRSAYPPSIAPYAALRHPQQNTRYHAWTAEGVSATSNTSCVVHVFTVSREMLRSVYEYVAYMCVAKRHAELQRRRRKREEHLSEELAAGRLTRDAQRYLRCPHCGVVGKVVRSSAARCDSEAMLSNPLLSSTLTQSQHLHQGRKRHHHNHHHSSASRDPPLASATTTPQPLLFPQSSTPAASAPLELPVAQQQQQQQQQHTERVGWSASKSPSPRPTPLPPQPPRRSAFGMGSATEGGSRVAVENTNVKVDECASAHRAVVVDEVSDAVATPPVSAVPQSPATALASRVACAPLTRGGSGTSVSSPALPPLPRSASLPPLRLQPQKRLQEEDRSSQESSHIRSTSAPQLPGVGTALLSSSPSPLPPPPLFIPTVGATASPAPAKVHTSPPVPGTKGAAPAGTTNSSDTRVEALLDTFAVSGELSQSLHMNSQSYEPSARAAFDRYAGASGNDLRALRQQPPTTVLARGAHEARPLDESATALLPRKTAEERGRATSEDAALQQSSSRAALANSNSHSLRVGGIDSDAEDGRRGRAGSVAPHTSGSTASHPFTTPTATSPDRSMLMAPTGTRDTTATHDTAAALSALVASADSSPSKCAPPTATSVATTTAAAVMTTLNAEVRVMGSSSRSNPNTNNMSGTNSLLCLMAGSTLTPALPTLARWPTPLQSQAGEDDGDNPAVAQRWCDTDAPETARDHDLSGGASYVCLGCHRDVIPKQSFLTSISDHSSSHRHSQHAHHSAARHSHHTNNNTNSGGGDANVDDGRTEQTVGADIGVMAFEDLLQDDTFTYALHTALCELLMMPSTREPPPLSPPLPTAPHKRSRKRSPRTSAARTDLNGFLHPVLPSAPVHQTDAPLQHSSEDTAIAATDAEGEVRRAAAMDVGALSCLSPGVPHQQSPEAMGGGGAVSFERIGSYIGDTEGELTQQQREPPTAPPSISAAPSSSSTSSMLTSLESSSTAADREGGCCSAASSPVRLSLPCRGLTVSVLPYVEPQVPPAATQERASHSGIQRRGTTEKHLIRGRHAIRKTIGIERLPRQSFGTLASLSRPVIPRMREDAATRGLTPSTMLMSDAAASHQRRRRSCSKQRQGPRIHPDTPPRQGWRRSTSTAASKLTSMESPPNAARMHSAAASKALIMKGTFSSEKHRIQVNPRTPLDAVIKNRIMKRIFRQERLGSRSDTTAAAVARLSETERRYGKGLDPIAAAAAVSRRDGAGPAAGVPVSARGSDMRRRRCPPHHRCSYTQKLAQQHAQLLLPPGRVPKQLGLDLGAYEDSSLVLEIDLAYPRLPRGNVRELLAEWKGTCQPHPVLVEAVIRNIVYAVLVQLSTLHAAGRTHGSVKSTNVFPLWHAMEGTRESGLMMPPRPRQRPTSPSPLAVAHAKYEAEPMHERGGKAEATITNEAEGERPRTASNAEGEGACESGGGSAAVPPATNQAATVPQWCTSETSTSPTNPRSLSNRQRHLAPHTAAAHLRLSQTMRSRNRGAQSRIKPARGFGAARGTPSAAKSSASAALPGRSGAATADASSTGLATAMAVYRPSSFSASTGCSLCTDSKQADPSTVPHMPVGLSPQSSMPSSPSAVLSSEPMPTPTVASACSPCAALLTTDAIQPYHPNSCSRSTTTFSPAIGMMSNSTRLRRGGGAAARLRHGSIGTNVGGKDDVCDSNGDAEDEDDSALVPLVAEVLTLSSTVLRTSAAEPGTAEPQTQLQNGLWGTPPMNVMRPCASFAAVPRHRDYRCGPHRSRQGRGSWSSAVEDPEEWLASAVPRRYVCGVELRPPAAVWFPRVAVDKAALAGKKPSVDHGVSLSADAATVLERTSDVAAQPVLTQGPMGAVPHPRFDSIGSDDTNAPEAATAHRERRRSSSAGPSPSSSAALHGASDGAGQYTPDPLQWSRQVLLVENVGAVVAAALRTAMACVLMRHPPCQHPSPLSSPLALATSTKTPISHSEKACHAADALADPATAAAERQGLRQAACSKPAAAAASQRRTRVAASAPALRVHVPDVVRSPPPLPPNLFSIQESEYVPAPELIRFSADEARALRRPWPPHPSGAAAADEVEGEQAAGEHPGLCHSSMAAAVDAGAEGAAQLREALARLEAAASPMTTLLNTLDPYPAVSAAADIWELGMMARELADGPPPMTWLKQREPAPALRTYPWSSYFHAFVSLCLQRSPEQRGTAAELLRHPWFSVALVPQASLPSPPTAMRSNGSDWGQGTAGSGAAGAPVESRNSAAGFQGGKTGGAAPVSPSTLPLLPVRPPGVMGVGCLTAEEKAEWENYDYTLLYASGAQSTRPLTTSAAAATAAVATAAENHHPSGNSSVRLECPLAHQTQGATTSASAVSAGARNSREASAADAIGVGKTPSLLGQSLRGTDAPSPLPAAAAAAVMASQSSALTVSSPGGGTAVGLPSVAAASASPAKASANDELMTSMCAVDLAQSFAELIAQRWVTQQQQLVPSLATAAGAHDGAAKGRQSMSPSQRNFFTAAAAVTSLDSASPVFLSVISPRCTTAGAAAAAAAYNAASPRCAPSTAGQGAVSQQQSELLRPKISSDEMMVPMWGGHSTAFSNNASLSGQLAVVPVVSPRGASSPLLLPPPEFVGRGVGRLLPAYLPTLYVPLLDPRGDPMLTPANAWVPPWTARTIGEWGGMAGIQSQPQPQQARSSAALGAVPPWFQLSTRVSAGSSNSLMYPTLQRFSRGDGSVSGGGGSRPVLHCDRGDPDGNASTGSDRSSNSQYHGRHARTASGSSSQSSPFSSTLSDSDSDSDRTASGGLQVVRSGTHVHASEGRFYDACMPKVGGEVPVPTRTPPQHLNDTLNTASPPLNNDTASRSVTFKVGTSEQRAGGGYNVMVYDPTTDSSRAAVKEGVFSFCAAAPTLRPPGSDEHWSRHGRHGGSSGRGDDGDYGAVPRVSSPSSSRPAHHLSGTIATALARLSMIAYLPTDADGNWSETSSSSSSTIDSSSDSEDGTRYSDRSDSAILSLMWGPSVCQSTPLESDDKTAYMQGFVISGDGTSCEEPNEDDDGPSMSAEVRCDELLRCLSVLQRNCPAAVSLWCVRVLQQAMRHPRTAASAARVLERIESLLPKGWVRNLDWLKQPDGWPSPPHSSADPLGKGDAQRRERVADTAGDGSSSLSGVRVAVRVSSRSSAGALPPAELDTSPSTFQNYEMAKWMHALHQVLQRCT